jgi:hypothetical protein
VRRGPGSATTRAGRGVVVRRRRVPDEHAYLHRARLGVHGDALDQLGDDRALLVAVHRIDGGAHRRQPGVHGGEARRVRALTTLVHLRQLQAVQERRAVPLDRRQLGHHLVLGVEALAEAALHPAPLQREPLQLGAQRARGLGTVAAVALVIGLDRAFDLGAEVAGLGDELPDVLPDHRLQLVGAHALPPCATLAVDLIATGKRAPVVGVAVLRGGVPAQLPVAVGAVGHRAQEVVVPDGPGRGPRAASQRSVGRVPLLAGDHGLDGNGEVGVPRRVRRPPVSAVHRVREHVLDGPSHDELRAGLPRRALRRATRPVLLHPPRRHVAPHQLALDLERSHPFGGEPEDLADDRRLDRRGDVPVLLG